MNRTESGDGPARKQPKKRTIEHEILERVAQKANECDPVTVGDVLDAVGRRSYSPVLLISGLIMMTPIIGDIPGVPVLMGLIVIIAATQLILGRNHLWVPDLLARQAIASDKLNRVVSWLEPPCRFIDRWTRPRLEWVLGRVVIHAMAALSIVIAATTPLLELVPFSATIAGLAISAFALGLFARDGLIAMFSVVVSAVTLSLLFWQLL